MSISTAINSWFVRAQQLFFTYSDGFFNLPYLSNSPEAIVESCKSMPFMDHDDESNTIRANNLFMKGDFFYMELEEGFWLLITHSEYKRNVSFKPIYDKNIPVDYYYVCSNKLTSNLSSHYYTIENLNVTTDSINFCKPKKQNTVYHLKNSTEKLYMLYFNEKWLQKNIMKSPSIPKTVHDILNNDDIDFLNFNFKSEKLENIIGEIDLEAIQIKRSDILRLKFLSYEYLKQFVFLLDKEYRETPHNLTQKDLKKLKLVEQEIQHYLHDKFPGIDFLSQKFRISATKLKKDFKAVHGTTLLDFHRELQMQIAMQYVVESDLKISEIANKLGYSNVGKFSQAFKRYHKELPSYYR